MMDHHGIEGPAIAATATRASASPAHRRGGAKVVIAVVVVVALLAGCQQAPDFRPYVRQATEVVRGAAPALDRLMRRLPELSERARVLAGEGAAELAARLADNQRDAAVLRQQIEGLPGKIGSAMKTGKAVEVERTLALARQEIASGLTALRSALDATAAEVARVEAEQPAGAARSAAK